nr:PREDICTED: uncharacterized protein LOC107766691 isoform X2 [Nicotiana tabacum]
MISEALQQSFMDTKLSTSNLPWIWVIETLASSDEIDTSLLIDLVKQTPEVSYDMGRNARELVSLRFLETLSVQEMSNANDVASILSDKIEFDRSVYSEDVLRRLFSGKMAGPEVPKWDVQSFITKKRSCLPKCALQQIKDAILDTTNPLCASLREKSGLEVGSHSRDGDRFNAVDLNGIKQSHEVRGTDGQHEHVLPNENTIPLSPGNESGLQDNQPRTLVPSKRRIDTFTVNEGKYSETEPISKDSSDRCVKASKKFKQEVISSRCNVVHGFESSQRDGHSAELSAGNPHAIVRKGNLENRSLVGGLDCSCECAASNMVRQSIGHDELLPQKVISEGKIQNVGSSSKPSTELRTSSGSSQQVVHEDSRIHGTEEHRECNRGDLFKDEPSKGAKKNAMEDDKPEVSSDSDGYHNEKTGLSAKRDDFVNYSQCTQGQDSLATQNGRELNLCVKCNEGGQLLVCSSGSCPLVVHQSCLGSVPSFDNEGNFYCPFCAYSQAISEYLEGQKMASLARKDLASFVGVGARRRSKKSSRSSHGIKKNQSREDEELCHDNNIKGSLNKVTGPRSAPVSRNSLDGEVMEMPSPQPAASVPHEPVAAGQKSKKSPPRSHRLKQKLSREQEELCPNENSNKNSLNEVQEPGNAPVCKSSPNAEVAQTGSPQTETFAPPELVGGQTSFVEESSEDEDATASKYYIGFRNADKTYTYLAIPQVRQKHLHRKSRGRSTKGGSVHIFKYFRIDERRFWNLELIGLRRSPFKILPARTDPQTRFLNLLEAQTESLPGLVACE